MSSIIKAAGVAALITTLSVGSASAGSGAWKSGTTMWGKTFNANVAGTNVTFGNVLGVTFAAWTIYRFFQNCGPFRCS